MASFGGQAAAAPAAVPAYAEGLKAPARDNRVQTTVRSIRAPPPALARRRPAEAASKRTHRDEGDPWPVVAGEQRTHCASARESQRTARTCTCGRFFSRPATARPAGRPTRKIAARPAAPNPSRAFTAAARAPLRSLSSRRAWVSDRNAAHGLPSPSPRAGRDRDQGAGLRGLLPEARAAHGDL